MQKTKLIYFGVGLIMTVIIIQICFQNMELVADKLNLAGIITNVLIAVLAVTYFQNREGNTRALKEYFSNEIKSLKDDYEDFIESIKSEKLNSNTIKKKFKDFSIKKTQLEVFLKNEMKIQNLRIQKKNREIHRLITDSYGFNSIYDDSNFSLTNEENNEVINLHKELNYHLTSLIIQINKS